MEHTKHKLQTTPGDFFLNLGVMVALYATVISLLALLYGIINFYFPDQYANDYYYMFSSGRINGGIAALFVLFPLFLILATIAERGEKKHPEKRELWIRRWLVYLTLFIAGGTMAGDLIALLTHFLGGELTMRFLLKVLVVFLLTGSIFAYFMYDLRRKIHEKKSMQPYFAGAAALVIVVTFVFSFSIIGSPFKQYDYRLDEQRIQNLIDITQQVIYHRQNFNDVPISLDQIAMKGFIVPRDPKTQQTYEFRRISDMKFELCANFKFETRPIDINARNRVQKQILPGSMQAYEWEHGIGKTCFEREIFPDQIRTGMPYESLPTDAKIVPIMNP